MESQCHCQNSACSAIRSLFCFFFFLFFTSNIQSIWSPDHALAWHLEKDFRNDPSAWATAKCMEWDRKEELLPNFMEEIIDCPCTLAQARADTGRFHVSY